jgi:orotidine-5'-phosphate decarboxylase
MNNSCFADTLIEAIKRKGTPTVVGLDPRLDQMPPFVWKGTSGQSDAERIRAAISRFHGLILDIIAPSVPAVKPQIAFYEQYGIGGILGFADTLEMAKKRGLLVIVDAKRNDISSTAQAYANAFLGSAKLPWGNRSGFEADCITISPFLGRDSLAPFVQTCSEYGKGVFILVKTSNEGSRDLQDLYDRTTNSKIYVLLAKLVDELAASIIGESGYSSIGAVVGATFPDEARQLRSLMPRSIFLVPGYGAQGGTAKDASYCFNSDGLGAVVNASRSITYSFPENIDESGFVSVVQAQLAAMVRDLSSAVASPRNE